ncbi:SDR family oxidoreductase [Sphingomonas sp. G-3-2-10]|uniref:SDR family oxidoreductase n=1 Tax=Sphingomonas sp. G-3-2-10 TaxID=2728838 RepID=UPI00146EE98B|nr:SDR family oxidoreductase [Sphingomonas sp. G-3-2-10]
MIRFDGQVAVIVGAGAGLGATLARRFAEAGADMVVAARTAASLEGPSTAVRAAGGQVLAVETDIADPVQAERLAAAAMARFGRIDVLVNAAFPNSPRSRIVDLTPEGLEAWRRTVEIGGYGTLLACRFVAPHMIAAGRGAIVNVTSMSSRIGYAERSDYGAGKGQGHLIAHALADELGPHGVRVNCVAPGHIWSAGLERFYRAQAEKHGTTFEDVLAEHNREMALRRIVTEDEVANAVLFLASDLASGITGAVIDVNAGHQFTP